MKAKHDVWISGLLFGTAAGVAIGSVMTFLDWHLNPGGIFHSTEGTNWRIVQETMTSWFFPTFVIVGGIVICVKGWLEYRK